MERVAHPADMQALARRWRGAGLRIAFVPTMGFLHEGHLALVRCAHELADRVVLSIFVNPMQFDVQEDLAAYPRDLPRDLTLCRGTGVDAVFLPAVADIYAPDASIFVDESVLSAGLCGAARPGHFRGVLTVVAKLFNCVLPDVAVFGQKDAQQACLVRRLVRDLNFPIKIQVVPTVRESDGLAQSSRNTRLAAHERREAVALFRSLELARQRVADGIHAWAEIEAAMRECIRELAPSAAIEYISAVDPDTLQPVADIQCRVLVALAVWIGATRLIDNAVIESPAA
jgi:pantoate--beta-alanine ligase